MLPSENTEQMKKESKRLIGNEKWNRRLYHWDWEVRVGHNGSLDETTVERRA